MSDPDERLKPLRTWSHLADRRRRPSEYEIVSTNLIYNLDPEKPFELGPNIPMSKWFRQYRFDCPLTQDMNWEDFRDPDEMTYRAYNILQDGQETYVEGLLDEFNELEHDSGLESTWVDSLQRLYTPSRYLIHTAQMASHYLVQIVPSSTIRSCAIYQAADQMRALSHVSYRTAELAENYPDRGFSHSEREAWENDPAWQGFRELMENVLVTYDWGEGLTALNIVAKPAIDECLHRQLAASARRHNDALLAMIADSIYKDVQRSRTWTAAIVRFAAADTTKLSAIREWVQKWQPMAANAIKQYCDALPDSPDAEVDATAAIDAWWRSIEVVA